MVLDLTAFKWKNLFNTGPACGNRLGISSILTLANSCVVSKLGGSELFQNYFRGMLNQDNTETSAIRNS